MGVDKQVIQLANWSLGNMIIFRSFFAATLPSSTGYITSVYGDQLEFENIFLVDCRENV